MNESKRVATTQERERAVLRAICGRYRPGTARVQLPTELEDYSWQEPDHRVVYAALRKAHDRASQPLREQLTAISTRLGFPDIDWDNYFTNAATTEAELREAVHLLLARGKITAMNSRTLRWLSIADVALLPALLLWFIWQLQFTAPWTWIIFAIWLVFSFAVHRDTPKRLGWRADNLRPAARQASVVFGLLASGLAVIGIALHSDWRVVAALFGWRRLEGYFAFCLLQQVALNSLLHNRMMSLVRNEWAAAGLTGAIFAAIHWPNPVLVPATFVAGTATAWMFGRHRNIIPLAIGQAIVGSLLAWAFPMAWHHHLRVGPGYFGWPR